MTSTSLAIRPEATPIRCCPKECDYRVEAVEHYLGVIEAFRANREDPTVKMRGQLLGEDKSGGTAGDQAIALWDVQRVSAQLRSEGREVTAVSVAGRLCPWSLEG